MKFLMLWILLGSSWALQAKTMFSEEIEKVQIKYANNFKSYPILIFDQDELEYRYALAGALGDVREDEVARAEILASYVREKVGVSLKFSEAMSIEPYTSTLKGGAYAVPIKRLYSDVKYLMCAVFPASANSNKRLENERILGMGTEGTYEKGYGHIKEKLSYDELRFFSIYHELAHCMDETFMPQNYSHYQPEGHTVHESESFAEVLGLFLMEREGLKGTGVRRAHYRNLYARVMGKWLIENAHLSFGNPLMKQGGVIYYLTPALIGAHTFIEKNRKFTIEATIEELKARTIQIVNKHSLRSRSMSAIQMWMEKGDEAVTHYSELAYNHPEYFSETIKDLLAFKYNTTFMMEKTFDEDQTIEGQTYLPVSVDQHSACEAFQNKDQETLETMLDGYRQHLRSAPEYSDLSDQKNGQETLNSFYKNLSRECHL